jgi:hypothetical protein
MHAIEFHTTINHGIIEVPKQYLPQLSKYAKVIVLMEETSQQKGLLAQLLQQPIKRHHFTPLRREEIYEQR